MTTSEIVTLLQARGFKFTHSLGQNFLIDDGVLSSLDIIQLIGALNDEFDISIPATEIVPANFNSVDAMTAMVERLADE